MKDYNGYKQIGYPDVRNKLYFPIESNRYGLPAPYGIQLNPYHDNKMVSHILKSIYENDQKRAPSPKTIRNRLHEETFPLHPLKQGGRKNFWLESDVDKYIEELKAKTNIPS